MLYRCLIVVLGCAGCFSVSAAPLETAVVENAQVRLVFVVQPQPFLQQLIHKPSGKNLLAEPASPVLFSMLVSSPGGGTNSIESQQARQTSFGTVPFAGGQRVQIGFSGFAKGNFRVRLEGKLYDTEPTIRWSVAVDGLEQQRLITFRFPCIVAVPQIGAPADDFIVAPALPGTIIENPARNMWLNQSLAWPFPGQQSAQFFSYQNRTAGVYVASMDTVGYGRTLCIAKRSSGFLLYHEYQPPEKSLGRWASPYDVALGVTAGTWQQTADLYKRWAVQQPWCARTLAQRDDIPAFWKQGPCIHTVEVRTYDSRSNACNGSYYPQLLEHLRSLREKIGGPVVPMLAGWENHRRWTAGDYFPVFDAAHAGRVLGQLRQDGFPPFFYLSGLYFTFNNEGVDGSPVSGSAGHSAAFVIDRQTGQPKTDVLSERDGAWKRHSYEFCPAAPGTRKFFRMVLDQLHALGVHIVQMDQATTGAGDACYSAAHGHEPGRGPYQAQAFHDLLGDMRRHGRSLCPDFLLMNEEVHEELIPYLDGFHTREYREGYWYRSAPGARGIPLFTYLYHEYAIAYGGEGPSASKAKNPAVVREHAVNLVTGKTPAVSVWSRPSAMAEAHPDQIKMLRNHVHLLKGEGQRFLMLGRMLHSLEFEVPSVTLQLNVNRDKKWHSEPFVEQAVLTSSWQAPDGWVGHCLVNITDVQQRVRLQLDTRNAPGWAQADIDLYHAEKPDTAVSVLRGVALPCEYALELEPLEAVLIVLRPAK